MKPDEKFYSSNLTNCVLNAFLAYSAIMLNFVTIQAIRKTPSLSKPLKVFLLNLAVSDLCVGLMAEPLQAAVLAMQVTQNTDNNPSYDGIFVAFRITVNLFGFASCLLVTALIADRFLSIHSYLRYQQLVTYQRVVSVVISIWAFSSLLSVVRLFLSVGIIHTIFACILFLCVTTVAFLSFKIYLVSRNHIDQIHALQLTAQQAAGNGELANVARLRKFAMAAVYVCFVFLVCYLPNMCILWSFVITSKPIHLVLNHYAMTLVFFNSSLNPLIYCWKMRHIRQAVMNILRSLWFRHH